MLFSVLEPDSGVSERVTTTLVSTSQSVRVTSCRKAGRTVAPSHRGSRRAFGLCLSAAASVIARRSIAFGWDLLGLRAVRKLTRRLDFARLGHDVDTIDEVSGERVKSLCTAPRFDRHCAERPALNSNPVKTKWRDCRSEN